MGKQSKRVTFEDLEGRESILAVANRTNIYLLLLFFYSVFADKWKKEIRAIFKHSLIFSTDYQPELHFLVPESQKASETLSLSLES